MADRYWFGDGGDWSDTAHWGTASNGVGAPAAVPTSADDVYFDANSFTIAAQTVTVDASAACLAMNWTGATDTPTLAHTSALNVNGVYTGIAGMAHTGASYIGFVGAGAYNITWGVTLSGCGVLIFNSGTRTFQDALVTASFFSYQAGTIVTGNFNITCAAFNITDAYAKTLTLGSSTGNCTSLSNTGTVTISANTATINVSGTGTVQLGSANWNGASFNLTGTAHTVSGSPTGIGTFTRTGTATKTDTLTLTSGATLTCTTFAPKGNSVTNRLLVQSSTLSTAATITATNWTGWQNTDLMDITATNAIDLSAGSAGDCGGNTDITFTTAAAQISNAAGNWSTLATWQDGAGTDRVPLPQDDVSCSHNVTVEMPRIGKSITFTGTPTITLSNDVSNYGSFTLPSGATYTHSSKYNVLRGRGGYTLTSAGKTMFSVRELAYGGTYTLQDNLTLSYLISITEGTFDINDFNITASHYTRDYTSVSTTLFGNGVMTLNRANGDIFYVNAGDTIIAENSTIILSNAIAGGTTFTGRGKTYHHVRVEGAGAYTLTITGDNTFEKLRNDSSVAAKTILLTPASTQTIRKLQVFSSAANVAVFNTGGAAATIQKHRGYCEISHVSLTSIVATEKYRYYADRNSTDGTGNTNWIFTHKARYVEVI